MKRGPESCGTYFCVCSVGRTEAMWLTKCNKSATDNPSASAAGNQDTVNCKANSNVQSSSAAFNFSTALVAV